MMKKIAHKKTGTKNARNFVSLFAEIFPQEFIREKNLPEKNPADAKRKIMEKYSAKKIPRGMEKSTNINSSCKKMYRATP
jgi:hypothetical protein